jgi:hypothetical protein
MSYIGWIVLAIVNIPVYIGFGWVFFGTWDDFLEAVRYKLTPDIISLFRGEYWEDWWAETKFSFWLLSCALFVVAEGYMFSKIFG